MSASRIDRAGSTVEARVGVTRAWKRVSGIGNIDDISGGGRSEDSSRRTVGARYMMGMADANAVGYGIDGHF